MGDPTRATRYTFAVTRQGDQVAVTMEFGKGLVRVRQMPPDLLTTIGDVIRLMLDRAKRQMPAASDIPLYPGSLRAVTAGILGACRITLSCHRLSAGGTEWVAALYDEGDDVPVLVLVEEQIEEFLGKT